MLFRSRLGVEDESDGHLSCTHLQGEAGTLRLFFAYYGPDNGYEVGDVGVRERGFMS